MARKLKDIIRRYLSLSALIDTLDRKQIALLNPQSWDDKNDRNFMQVYKEKKNYSALYAMCAATCSETYHHWRVFTPGADGACLELFRKPFETALKEHPFIRFRKVKYVALSQVDKVGQDDLELLPFYKRLGFAAEAEYRVIAWTDKKQAPALGVPLDLKWVSRIELNPWMPEPLAESMSRTIRRIPDCKSLKVSHSSLIDNRRWREAGDRAAGRKTPPDLTRIS